MNIRSFITTVCMLSSALAYGADSTLIQYHQSYKELSSMLSGSSPVSYERAVYLVENAWWGGNLDYNRYTRILDAQTTAIKLIAAGYHKPADSFTDAGIGNPQLLGKTAAERKAMHDKAVLNYAIYSYMRDTNLFVLDSSLYVHLPVSYTHTDPMGSTQWANTQVGHLLATGQGNCYAMASLYKILADRLHTDAALCTAPGHIYIRHADENGIMYNVEPGSSNSFPGTGSMATLTYSSNAAIANGISMRSLTDKAAIAMCLVYLAKGYEKQYNSDVDAFAMQCATTALQYDANNLNAMLLQAEVLERRLLLQEPLAQLQQTATYKEYEALLTKLYTLGYREMPQDMKNTLVALYNKENIATNCNKTQQTNIVGVSGGLFPETIPDRETEQYGSTLYNTKTGKITGFAPQAPLYNHYNFDPVVFAWNMDPMAYKFPYLSPYSALANNPILMLDNNGDFPWSIHIRSFISTPTTGGGLFIGDGRNPSLRTDRKITSRVRSQFIVDPAQQIVSDLKVESDPTVFFGTGSPLFPGYIPPKIKKGSPDASIQLSNFIADNFIAFDFSHSGKDPITPAFATPALDVHGSFAFTEDHMNNILRIWGAISGDKFPSTEAFIVDPSGKGKLFLGAAMEDGGLSDLFGDNKEPLFEVDMEIKYDKQGNFQNVSSKGKVYTIDEWNAKFVKPTNN